MEITEPQHLFHVLDLDEELEKWITTCRASRVVPSTWRRVGLDGRITGPAYQRLKVRHPLWETAIVLAYSVDIVPDLQPGAAPGAARLVEALSFEFSVPTPKMQITQGMLNHGEPRAAVLAMVAPIVGAVFGLTRPVKTVLRAHPAVPVVDSREDRKLANVHLRTPISAHFIVDADWDHAPLDTYPVDTSVS